MFKIFLFFIIVTQSVIAKDFTKPPSVALRNEVSFVSEVTLLSKKTKSPGKTLLSFKLSKKLHNKPDEEVNILVESSLAKELATNEKYIVAYQISRKTKIKGQTKYIRNANGPFLINVEGASPAIFRTNERLIKQLTSSPQLAKTNPDALLNDIFLGMSESDPKIQTFFVRELINWGVLHKHLNQENFKKLFEIYNSTDTSAEIMTALLENRPHLHTAIGHKKLGSKAINMLKYTPVTMDLSSEIPSMVLQAMIFVKNNKLANWDSLSRWTRSNAPSITERALLILNSINPTKTLLLAEQRVQSTQISDTSRRVLIRFIAQKNREKSQ